MAEISERTLDIVFDVQRQLLQTINSSNYLAFLLFERHGETTEIMNSLQELDNVKEKLTNSYSQLNTLMLRISEYQPTAPAEVFNLLATSTNRGISRLEAAKASILEVKQYWRI